MFGRKKRKENIGASSSFVLRLLVGVNQLLIRSAAWLGKRAGVFTQNQLKLLLALFCIVLTGLSTYVIISSLGEKRFAFAVTPIRPIPLVEKHALRPVITEEEYRRFHQLRLYLDSLAQTREGKHRFDSILQHHPHLLDTLSFLERLYYQQQKN